MFETVTVDEALAKAKRSITYPSLGIFIGGIILVVILVVLFPRQAAIFSLGGLAVVFVSAWLYWGLAITKWRLWAFENVRNVHELKKRAVQNQLIWKDGSWFEKTEIRTAEDKMRWANLQVKFNQRDIFHDDLDVPVETEIRYSKKIAMFLMIIGVAFFCGIVFFTGDAKVWIVAIILTLIGAFLFIEGYRHYNNHDPQITISNAGVSTIKAPFYGWADIIDEDTKVVQHGKSRTVYFIYTCPEGEQRVDIGVLDINKSNIEKLLRVYRGRFENKVR